MKHLAKYLLKTAIVVGVLTILLSIAWDAAFPRKIYFCTDEIGFDYFLPGSLVHGEIEIVDDVPSAFAARMDSRQALDGLEHDVWVFGGSCSHACETSLVFPVASSSKSIGRG